MHVRNTVQGNKTSRICQWDVERGNKMLLWVPLPSILTASSHISCSCDSSRLSFIGLVSSFGPSFSVAKRGRLMFPRRAWHTPCLLCMAVCLPLLLTVEMEPQAMFRVCAGALWGCLLGVCSVGLRYTGLEKVGNFSEPVGPRYLGPVYQKSSWFGSSQVFKSCPTIYKNDADYSVFISLREPKRRREVRYMTPNQYPSFLQPISAVQGVSSTTICG